MDDIKRPKIRRADTPAPTRRQVYVRRPLAGPLVDTRPSQSPPQTVSHRRRIPHLLGKIPRVGQYSSAAHPLAALSYPNAVQLWRCYRPKYRKHPVVARFGWASLAALMMLAIGIEMFGYWGATENYMLSAKAEVLVGKPSMQLAKSLKYDAKAQMYHYNQDYVPGGEVAGQSSRAKFTGSFPVNPSEGASVTDPVNRITVKFIPQFGLRSPVQNQNRLIYPIAGSTAQRVDTLKAIGLKEDIVLNNFQGDTAEYKYKLELPDGTEARMESNGALSVYGVKSALLGNVNTSTEKDKELLKKARQNGTKSNLLFTFPAPFVKESGKKISQAKAWFTYKDGELTIHASGLKQASYPLTIDPSVYIETAAKLMQGNNETNTDFDFGEELIQKSQTTGARIDEWTDTTNMNGAYWGNAVAAAGGYVYASGGVEDSTTVVEYTASGADTFVVPTGVTSIIVKAWGGGAGGGGGGTVSVGGAGGGGGFAQATLTVTPAESLSVYVGAGGGAGNFSTGTAGAAGGDGGGGGGRSYLERSGAPLVIGSGGGGGGGGDDSSATPGGAGGAGGGTTGIAGSASSSSPGGGGGTASAGGAGGNGTTTDGTAGGSEFGGNGGDGGDSGCGAGGRNNGGNPNGGDGGTGDDCLSGRGAGGGGGDGYFGGGGGAGAIGGNAAAGGGGGGSTFTSGTGTSNIAGSGSTAGNSSDTHAGGAGQGGSGGATSQNGTAGTAGKVVIIYSTGSVYNASLHWAKFNSTTRAIDSPNPGSGVCSGWCTSSVYNLPEARRGHSMVAYNGFLYVIGGIDGSGNRENTVFITKLGANGEPSLWHPTDSNPNNWVYWYASTNTLSAATSYASAVAYNNYIYLVGGQTNASSGGVTTVSATPLSPTGDIGAWTSTGMQALPAGAGTHMHSVQVYNDTLYAIGGFEGAQTSSANLRSAVYYSKLNSNGTMNAWTQTKSFATGRATFGGSYSSIWGAYIYLGGGCTAVNASGYCTTVASDIQIASINADGTLDNWSAIGGLDNQRIGYTLMGWQGGLYRFSGCASPNTSTGTCDSTLIDVDYGEINPAGEVSTVNVTEPSGTAPCSGGSPQNCDLPPTGDAAGQGGQMLNASAILNGYLYVIGGCTNFGCSLSSGNVSYVSIGSDGSLQAPSSCGGTSYGAWCVDSTNRVNGTSGVSAAGITTFNDRIYVVAGIDETTTGTQNIYYNTTNTNGSLTGAWSSVTLATAGIAAYTELAYTYAFARANPSSAGTNPGNLYIVGGCTAIGASAGCSNVYTTVVYKCNITTTGSVSGCTTTGQLQIDSESGTGGSQGLGLHSGTVYAGYIYLVGGFSDNVPDRDTVFYAKIDNSNNIVDAQSGTAGGGDAWELSPNDLSTGRRRGWAFGYNGHVYAVGGYDDSGTGIIPFIEWSKMDVSDGSISPFVTSSVTINQRWGLSMAVSNSYAYVIGGCDVGASPSGCSSFEASIQTFQLYNNDSGSVADFTAQSDQTFSASTDRIGASSTIHNGYLYVAGGCTNIGCTTVTNSTEYAPISATDGSIGTWSAGGNLPASLAWGNLEVAGGTLYYIGGQNSAGTAQSTVYYTSGISSGNPTWNGSAATNGLPSARTRFGSAVWNNRLYVVGGAGSGGTCTGSVCDTVYVSPQQSSGGNIASAWTTSTAFNVDREGLAVTAYANNLYLFGGYDGSNYLSDAQFASIGYKTGTISQSGTTVTGSGTAWTAAMVGRTLLYNDGYSATISSVASGTSMTVSISRTVAAGALYTIDDGSVGGWGYTKSLPGPLRDGQAVSANGYIYIVNGRSAATTCNPKVLIAPISANTTVATGNNPTGVGEWYETNVRYTGDRYGAAVAYSKGKLYTMGGGCSALLTANRHYQSSVNSQPQVATYSRRIDTDTNVFPTKWLMNGIDNSIGARWQVRYRSSTTANAAWGQETNFGDVALGVPSTYTPLDGAGSNTSFARWYFFWMTIDASRTFGYPEDVDRGPTIHDISLFYTADPSKRLLHGKTFTGGVQQPLDTPF
jgi:hypothetical protein